MDFLKDLPAPAETVLLAVAALIPGFVWYRASSMFVTKARHAEKAWLLEILTRSCFVHLVSGGALYWIAASGMHKTSPICFGYLVVSVLFGVPLALTGVGVLLAAVAFGIKPKLIRPAPEAWDDRFIRVCPCWVRIRLKDTRCVGGYYGAASAVSSNPDKRDIFIEYAFEMSENGLFVRPVPETDGLWIRGEDIQMIEFLKDKSPTKKEKPDGKTHEGPGTGSHPGDSGQGEGSHVQPSPSGADVDGEGPRTARKPADD